MDQIENENENETILLLSKQKSDGNPVFIPKTRVMRNGNSVTSNNAGFLYPTDKPISFTFKKSDLPKFKTINDLLVDCDKDEPHNDIVINISSNLPFDQDDVDILINFHNNGKIEKDIRGFNDLLVLLDISNFLEYQNKTKFIEALTSNFFDKFYSNYYEGNNDAFCSEIASFFSLSNNQVKKISENASKTVDYKIEEIQKFRDDARISKNIVVLKK